jgi:uncharacterized protein YbcI
MMTTQLIRNKADVEYSVMLAVLNFQTEFMKSSYTRAQVHIIGDVIEVTLARSASTPAEVRLAQSPEGRALLQQVHVALFKPGESLLREDLERALGAKIQHIFTGLDTISGTNTMIIRLAEPLETVSLDASPDRYSAEPCT